jgi:hypothetical protein
VTEPTKADLQAKIEKLEADKKTDAETIEKAYQINQELAAAAGLKAEPETIIAVGDAQAAKGGPAEGVKPNGRVGADPAATPQLSQEEAALKQLTQVRYYSSEREREETQKRQTTYKWPHAAPNSVLVAAIGNSWKGDSWAKTMDMCNFAHKEGIPVDFREFQNRCFEPYDSLGTMRNEVFTAALMGGYEFVMMIDNDVEPQEDALYRLMMHDEPLISPYVEEPADEKTGRPKRVLHGPFQEPYSGVYKVKWNVLTMLLFKVNYVKALGNDFWQDAIGADEGYHFQKSYEKTGVYPKIDSSVVLRAGGTPLYPLTVRKSDQYEEVWQERRQRFDSVPDRSPVWGDDPRRTPQGVYLPFIPFPPAPEAEAQPKESPVEPVSAVPSSAGS